MFFRFKNHYVLIYFLVFIFLTNCQLKEPLNNHGIVFLKNRSEKLTVNSSNKNDAIRIIGNPHFKSIDNNQEWIYVERVLTKGEFINQDIYDKKVASWLPSENDKKFIGSLMIQELNPGKTASWISKPRRGINNQEIDFSYVDVD